MNYSNNELITEMKEAFSFFDQDGDGQLTIKEFETAAKSMTQCPHYIMDRVKAENKMTIDFSDFLRLIKEKTSKEDNSDKFLEACEVLDIDRKGVIAINDFVSLLKKFEENIKDEEIAELINENNKAEINYVEYKDFIKNIQNWCYDSQCDG